MGFIQAANTGHVEMKLYVIPAKVGENELGVDILDRRQGTALDETELVVRFTPPDPDLGAFQVQAVRDEGRRFSTRGSHFSIIGAWQVEIILRQPDMNDARHVFDVPIRADFPVLNDRSINPADDVALAQGQMLYQAYCQSCHGHEGKGDGPVGQTLSLPPADLSTHVAPGEHTNQQLFYYISEGFPSSAMPAFKTLLTEQERWQLVHFIRTFAR
jgi:mono/diheme cytochrome c family protein